MFLLAKLSMDFLKKDKMKLIQKAILTAVGIAASQETIKKAAKGIYGDVQKIIKELLVELEKSGEIKAKETKEIITHLQKKSEAEKEKIYTKLKKEGKTILNSAREIILTPMSVLKNTNSSSKTTKKRKRAKKKIR